MTDSLRMNGEGYYDPTAYQALKNIRGGEMDNTVNRGRVWTFDTDYGENYYLILAENEDTSLVMKLFDEERAENDITIKDVNGTKYGCSMKLNYMRQDRKTRCIRELAPDEYDEIKRTIANRLGMDAPREIVCVPEKDPEEESIETAYREALQELRETIEDLEAADGKLSQKRTARFILRYMDMLRI